MCIVKSHIILEQFYKQNKFWLIFERTPLKLSFLGKFDNCSWLINESPIL